MSKHLIVYYDNPTEPSDMYLKMIKKDAEEKDIKVYVCDSKTLLNQWSEYYKQPLLILEPHKAELDKYDLAHYINVDGNSFKSATATGIYEHIIAECPSRSTCVGVIGRGLVGSQLLDMLIEYGYTIVEINSKTTGANFENLLSSCDVIVGLSSKDNIIDEDQKDMIEFMGKPWWIDAGHNFDFDNRKEVSKCGKWTREVLFERIEQI